MDDSISKKAFRSLMRSVAEREKLQALAKAHMEWQILGLSEHSYEAVRQAGEIENHYQSLVRRLDQQEEQENPDKVFSWIKDKY
jgi:hypothetical protein